jgi:hypothetical protein
MSWSTRPRWRGVDGVVLGMRLHGLAGDDDPLRRGRVDEHLQQHRDKLLRWRCRDGDLLRASSHLRRCDIWG